MIIPNSKENFEISFSAERIKANLIRTVNKAFCLICEKNVELADDGQAAECFKTDVKEIRELAESRCLHRINNKSGAAMICSESLFTPLKSRPAQRLKPVFFPFNPADYKTSEDI